MIIEHNVRVLPSRLGREIPNLRDAAARPAEAIRTGSCQDCPKDSYGEDDR